MGCFNENIEIKVNTKEINEEAQKEDILKEGEKNLNFKRSKCKRNK